MTLRPAFVSPVILWLLSFVTSWGQAPVKPRPTPAPELAAYNDSVARSFMIEVEPLVLKHTGWTLAQLPRFKCVSKDEYAKVFAEEILTVIMKKDPSLAKNKEAVMPMVVQMARRNAEGLLGQYSHLTKTIYLLPGNLKPMMDQMGVEHYYTRDLVEVVIAHEMTHAVQDEKYPFLERVGELMDEEATEAYSTLREGHAMFVQGRVAKDLKLNEAADRLVQRMKNDDKQQGIYSLTSGGGGWQRYLKGARFVEIAFEKDGLKGVQAVFEKLPVNMGQINNPSVYYSEIGDVGKK